MLHSDHAHLSAFLEKAHDHYDHILEAGGLPAEQVIALRLPKRAGDWNPLGHPLTPFYLLVRAHGAPVGRDAEPLGAAFLMLHRALCLIDDVQDEELSGLYAEQGPALTVNHGLTLFYLALDAFWIAQRQGLTGLRTALRGSALRLFRGQYRDLADRHRPGTPDRAVNTALDKSAVFTLLLELAAHYARAQLIARQPAGWQRIHTMDPPLYRTLGDALTEIKQYVDDLTDVVDPDGSQDLVNGTWNVPLTLMLDGLPETVREDWAARLPRQDQYRLCRLLYETGAMERLAEMTSAARVRFHRTLARLPCTGPYAAMLLAWLDDLTMLVYRARPLHICPEIQTLEPTGLHPKDAVLFQRLRTARLAALGPADAVPPRTAPAPQTPAAAAATA